MLLADCESMRDLALKTKHKKLLPYYIKGLVKKKFSLKQAAESTGYNAAYLWQLKRRYLKEGDYVFQHKGIGHKAHNKLDAKLREKIAYLYSKDYADVNFKYFHELLEEEHGIKVSYYAVCSILAEYGLYSPRKHKNKIKKIHPPRPRRENEGDLSQMDATPYPWFSWAGDYNYYALHGAIDDATGKITGLYMCENECFFGYCAVKRMTIEKYGIPREEYTDRSAIFCYSPRDKNKLNIVEQLAAVHEKHTQWQRLLDQLCCRQVLAWSPQAKGRVERMWSTIQGRLPYAFKKAKIKDIDSANIFLKSWIEKYNKRFARKAKSNELFYRDCDVNLNEVLCMRFPRLTNSNGVFSFHGYKMRMLGAKYSACKHIVLCISEYGLQAELNGSYYAVQILSDLNEGPDTESMALKKILYDYIYRDCKKVCA
jgi:transposase